MTDNNMKGVAELSDTRARELAIEALTKIDAHTKECSAKYEGIQKANENILTRLEGFAKEVRSELRNLYSSRQKAIGSLLLVLLSVIGYLYVRNTELEHRVVDMTVNESVHVTDNGANGKGK